MSVSADSIYKEIVVAYRSLNIIVDNQNVKFGYDSAGNPIEPFIYNGTTYLPVRAVAEALGKDVAWDDSTGTIFIGDDNAENFKQNTVIGNSSPADTIDKLAESLNYADLDMLFECFEPHLAEQFKGSYELGNSVSSVILGVEIDSKAILKIIPVFSGLQIDEGSQFIWPTWYAENYAVEYSGDQQIAYLTCDLFVDMGNGQVDGYQGYFELVNINGVWLISDMR